MPVEEARRSRCSVTAKNDNIGLLELDCLGDLKRILLIFHMVRILQRWCASLIIRYCHSGPYVFSSIRDLTCFRMFAASEIMLCCHICVYVVVEVCLL